MVEDDTLPFGSLTVAKSVCDEELGGAFRRLAHGPARDGGVLGERVAGGAAAELEVHVPVAHEEDEAALDACELKRELNERGEDFFDCAAGVELTGRVEQPVEALEIAGGGETIERFEEFEAGDGACGVAMLEAQGWSLQGPEVQDIAMTKSCQRDLAAVQVGSVGTALGR